MPSSEIAKSFLKFFAINSCGLFVYSRILGLKASSFVKGFITFVFCLFLSAGCSAMNYYKVPTYTLLFAAAIAAGVYCSIAVKTRIDYTVTVVTISWAFSIVTYLVSATIITPIWALFDTHDPNSLGLFFLYPPFQFLMLYAFLSVRRFRRGFPYILKKYTLFFGFIVMGVTLFMTVLIGRVEGPLSDAAIFMGITGVVLSGVGIFMWIRRGIKAYYLRIIKERAIETFEEELREKDRRIEKLSYESHVISSASRELNQRLSALDRQIAGLAYQAENAEAPAPEYAEALEQLRVMAVICRDELNRGGSQMLPDNVKFPSVKTPYPGKTKDLTIEALEEELRGKDGLIERLSRENKAISAANHALTRKLSALELRIMGLAYQAGAHASAESAAEYSEVLEQLRKMAAKYDDELKKLPGKRKLLGTRVPSVDAMLERLQVDALSQDIEFGLKVAGSIVYMTERVIPAEKLDTLISDLVTDAFAAVSACGNAYRSVLIILGLVGEHFELSVLDSGAEFDIRTLLALGLRRVTNPAQGSGFGYMTTFETMKECGASLIIREISPPNADGYTKSVTVRFDGENEYRIESYRVEEIRRANEGKREIRLISA